MKNYVILLCLLFIISACGTDQGYYPVETYNGSTSSLVMMSLGVPNQKINVGSSYQLSVTVILPTGQRTSGLTDSFVYPDTNEERNIVWLSSNTRVASITQSGRLLPVKSGYVTISASIDQSTASGAIRVYDVGEVVVEQQPDINKPIEDTDEDPELEPEDDLDAEVTDRFVSCQGFAEAVVLFDIGEHGGYGSESFPEVVLGPPGGSTDVLSLGYQGEIILDLGDCQVADGDGVDFIVFENPFYLHGDETTPYAELGIVGVSSDGVHFTEFDCHEEEYPFTGCAGWKRVNAIPASGISPFDIDDAGGDQFDLSDIGIDKARYIKIRDLYGDGLSGNAFGFDLDAIAVVNGEREE